jgi:heme/copper-type cytochrome/quinol oxidase subunit 1
MFFNNLIRSQKFIFEKFYVWNIFTFFKTLFQPVIVTSNTLYEWLFWLKTRFSYSLNSWVYTTNHKRIAVNYFNFVLVAGTAGMSLATVIRLEFAYPGVGILAGDSLQYLSIATAHGVIMVFFMIMPLIFGAFGNFLLPTQLGVHDVAFPRLNSAAFWFIPGGLIMLCQLVCIDRRYQRMNCFNIRELQGILKRKFFTDLINSNDHRDLLNNSMIGVRYKLNHTLDIEPDIFTFYNFGLLNTDKVKTFATQSLYIWNYYDNKLLHFFISLNLLGLVTNTFNYYTSYFYKYYLTFDVWNNLVGIYMNFITLGNTTYILINKTTSIELFHLFIFNVTSINFKSFLNLYTIVFEIKNLLLLNFNFYFNMIPNLTYVNNFYNKSKLTFYTDSLNTTNVENNTGFIETTNYQRFLRFSNPLISYDYKCGNYLGIWEQLYPSLILSYIEVARGIRKSPWFFSTQYNTLLKNNYKNYNNHFFDKLTLQLADLDNWYSLHINGLDNYFNLFSFLNNNSGFINLRWYASSQLNQKFYKMFNSSSTQQRIISNWRQLKFSREAWRCKLLISRHQNTLYRRFTSEEGLVWSIERNAKDLLPGWAMITPFSARTRFTAIGKTDIGLMGVLIVLNASIVSSANFLVTYRYLSTLNNRKMRDSRSFFAEGLIVASWMMIAANPMLVIGIIMLICDRHWQTSFFDYSGGGDTVLFQHMFWFFGHPEVYVIMLPVFGFVNTIMSFYLRKRVSARGSLLYSMYTIAFLGFFVWGHHMYMVGLSHTTRMLFSTLTVMISVPAATKLMHWCVTIVNSVFVMELPFLFTFTFVYFFVSGGVSGMYVANTGMDILFHDTFYVIGHFHVMFAGSAMIGLFSAFYFYFPAIYGVKYSRIYGYIHYVYYILGQIITVVPMLWLGYCGHPRRVLDYPAVFGGWHSISSAGHLLSVMALLSFFFMIYDSIRQAKPTIRNNFGVSRFNTRLNFYFFEINRLSFLQRKLFFNLRLQNTNTHTNNTALNQLDIVSLETTLFSYQFFK